ncbi:MAG: translocation/assembly module TamB domain-containing protein [Deltaproteobacteria bacterium]|nr:translocation/assembly module TamB domain-containing protein [Deltaproteobacteria bacterium]
MKRWMLILSILVLILGLASWGIYRLTWTPEGLRWIFKTASRYSSLTCSAEKISGRMAGRLELEGLEIAWPEGRIRIRRLQTLFAPWFLLRGQMVFRQINVHQIVLEDNRVKKEPLSLTLPKINVFLARAGIEVHSFRLEAFTFRHIDDAPLVIKSMAGRLSFHHGILAINPFSLEGDQGGIQGSLGLNFFLPGLRLDLQWNPAKPFQGMDHLTIQARLTSGKGPEQIAGPVSIKSRSGPLERIIAQTEMGVSPHRIHFRKAEIREKGRKGLVKGQGEVVFDKAGPAIQALLTLEALDLSGELSTASSLSGPLQLEGRLNTYRGTFDLKNGAAPSWQAFRLIGSFQGNLSGLEVRLDRGEWLKGLLDGLVEIGWNKEISLSGSIRGRQLNPEGFHPRWRGQINLNAQGRFLRSASKGNQGSLMVHLLESRFQGKALQGELKVRMEKDALRIDRADIVGRGFRFTGHGDLFNRLDFEALVSDLSILAPDSRGSASARGWARWRQGRVGGGLTLEGKEISWAGAEIHGLHLKAALDQEKPGTAIDLKASIRKGVYRSFTANLISGEARGTFTQQKVTLAVQGPQGAIQAGLEGAFQEKLWKGTLVSFSGSSVREGTFRLQSPAVLQIGLDQFKLSPCILTGTPGESLKLSTDLGLNPLTGFLNMEWQQIELSRIGSYLRQAQIKGRTTGWIKTKISDHDRLDLQARADLIGTFSAGGRQITLSRAELRWDWDGFGLRSSWDLKTTQGARLWGQAASEEKGRPAWPERVKWTARWEGLDINLLKPEMPPGLRVEGKIMGQVNGEWTAGPRFHLKGGIQFAGGSLAWKDEGASFKARIKKADVGLDWAEDRLKGNLAVELEDYGKIRGDFRLPIPARFPVTWQSAGPLDLQIQGNLRERGMLTALLPDAALSGQGLIQGNLSVKGTWENPALNGNLELSEAGADIKPLGIQVREISAKGTFNQDQITITDLKMRSGTGTLNGRAILWIKDWKVARLQGKIFGDHFQFINRPGLEAQGSPDLDFSGTPGQLVVSGVLAIPEALISGGQPEGFKRASPDVQVVDAPVRSRKERVFPVQGEIRLLLGQKVRLKAEGLEGLLRGNLTVPFKNSKDLKAFGEIEVVQGNYLLQGQKLNVTRGRFSFNGPPDNPALDLLALRTIRSRQRLEDWVDEVKAGIAVTGRLQSPRTKLYSQPPLPDSDILSYILFGEPLKQGTGQQDLALLGKAAKTLLGGRMQGQLIGRLDLDTLEVRTDNNDLSRSVVTVGKYLDPRLFLGLGGSVFSNSYQVILRYTLTPHLEIETKGGTPSGGGIYFKVDFE